jgi:hypothetical protein
MLGPGLTKGFACFRQTPLLIIDSDTITQIVESSGGERDLAEARLAAFAGGRLGRKACGDRVGIRQGKVSNEVPESTIR